MNEEREFIRLMSEPMVSKRTGWLIAIGVAIAAWTGIIILIIKALT